MKYEILVVYISAKHSIYISRGRLKLSEKVFYYLGVKLYLSL
jgi:hypothetical protein